MEISPREAKQYPFIKASMLFIGISIVLFLVRSPNEPGQISGTASDTPPPPMPTAMDPNFETQINQCFLPIASLYGYTLRVTSGFRSLEEQEQLYAQGRTVDGHIVTYTLKSLHNFGFAVDVVDRFRGFEINWDKVGRIGNYCGLEQGDDEYDEKVHFQHREDITISEFEAGKRPKPLKLPCPIMATRAETNAKLTMADLQACGSPKF